MFLVLKLLVFYIWCCDGMRLGVQVMSACLVDASVAGRVAIDFFFNRPIVCRLLGKSPSPTFFFFSWNPNVLNRVHMRSPQFPILYHVNPDLLT